MTESTTNTFWQRLIAPHPAIADRRRQRRTRVLAGLSLLLLAIGVPLLLIITLAGTASLPLPAYTPFIVIAISYGLSRTRWPEAGAILITYGLAISSFSFLVITANPEFAPQVWVFLLMPILFSTLVLTAWYTIGLALLTMVSLTVFVAAVPWLSFDAVVAPYAIMLLLTVLAAGSAFIRERDIETLEAQTDTVDTYSAQLESDVQRIQAIAEVGQVITATRNLDDLLEQVVNLIVDRFDYYHAQVFLIDDARRYAVLRESTGEPGQQLLARGHKLEVGSQSVIGQVTSNARAVIARDTDTDAVHRRNELLPRTRSEMALPLQIGGRVIGALDVQSVEPDAFQDTDVSIFQTMADQLAVAIENARLFERAQRDLRNIERLNRQLTGEAWRDYMTGRTDRAPAGYQVQEGQIVPLDADEQPPAEPAYTVPLRVRGETIGMLDVTPREGDAPPPDEETRAMLEAVAERVALALDSTRLSEQAQRQARREQILSRVSAELQAVTDMNVILRVAAREASHALDAPRGFAYLALGSPGDDQGGEA